VYDTSLNQRRIKNPLFDNNTMRLTVRKKKEYNPVTLHSVTYQTKADREKCLSCNNIVVRFEYLI
jgi:hypothetical protein